MLDPGARVEDYEVVCRAAIGATAEVYEARHVSSGRRAAVKVLHHEWCLHAEIVARFLNEARALQRIQHSCVVEAIACGFLDEGPPFLILEWLPIDLDRALERAGGSLTARTAVRVATQISEALATLHEHGIVHRDLKPANVLADQEDISVAAIKLADLGLAKVPAGPVPPSLDVPEPLGPLHISTGSSALLGTWDYMAPEQWIRSKDAEPKTDVYALGALLFQLLAGRPPFVAEQQKDLMYFHLFEAPPLHLLDGRATAALQDLIAQMLSKTISPRPAMREVLEGLAGPL